MKYGVMWIAVSVAVCVSIMVTDSPYSLFAFIIPALLHARMEAKNRGE